MTNEEMQRTMEFILNQQAQFAADIQKLQESQQKMNESQVETIQLLNRLAAVTVKGFEDASAKTNALIDAQIRTDEKLGALADAQTRTDEKLSTLADAQTRTDEKLSALADAQTRTDEAVRNLTRLVERYFDGRRNGG
jgi:uncharacterized phage infection (PIP) family protein YhgE